MEHSWQKGGSSSELASDYDSFNKIKLEKNSDYIKDRYYVVRITMYLFGISSLLPWNFFIQANDYWMYKFRNVTHDDPKDRTELQATFSSYLAIASKVPYLLFLLVNTCVANRFGSVIRVKIPLLVMIILFSTVVILAPINTDYHQKAFFATTICTVIAINVLCGFFQGSATGIAGSLPSQYMGYNVKGQAVGGMLASFAQIMSLVGNTSATTSAIIYFVSAIFILCLTFGFFLKTIKSDFYNYYMDAQLKTSHVSLAGSTALTIEIFKKMWVYAVAITLIFWISLSVLPAVIVLILSTDQSETMWTDRLFIPVAGFFVFNACDLGGRILAQWITIPGKFKYMTLLASLLRVVFIPLIMLCNAQPREHLPVHFHDTSFVVIIFFFALTNGYLTNIIMTQAPKCVEEKYQELAGSQMAFFLGLGLMLGSVTSYGIVKLL